MGSVIENPKTREKCQIFTPDSIVIDMLDCIGYSTNLYGKTILESSCGNGQFLKEIVKRYIKDCQAKGLSRTRIRNGLSRDIFGIELDPNRYYECINELNKITTAFNIQHVNWQIKQADALRNPYNRTFDFVIGNPPYVSYWDLEISEREYIEQKFNTCRFGAWDYSYAFLQDGFNHLNSSGKMAYIIPNSIFKTKSGKLIRNLLLPHIVKIIDYTSTNVFDSVLTSPAIIVIEQNNQNSQITYQDLSKQQRCYFNKEQLVDEWIFKQQIPTANLSHRFGNYFQVATSIATQCNKVFVLTGFHDDGRYISNGNIKIEKDCIRKAASPRGQSNNTTEYIIFPYYYLNGRLQHYNEDYFAEKFPLAYSYLKSQKNLLDLRSADKKSQWFEYGRTQALTHINQKKLLLSTVITGKVHVYSLETNDVPYSGLFITIRGKQDIFTLSKAMSILTSDSFLKYIEPYGINARGKSIRITAKNIENYCW